MVGAPSPDVVVTDYRLPGSKLAAVSRVSRAHAAFSLAFWFEVGRSEA